MMHNFSKPITFTALRATFEIALEALSFRTTTHCCCKYDRTRASIQTRRRRNSGDAPCGKSQDQPLAAFQPRTWMATRSEDTRAWFNQRVSEYRGRALHNTAHARTPDILANLQAGFELLLEFAVDSGALDGGERDCLAKRCWDALGEAAAAQSQHQQETEPTALFLATLRSGLSSGRAHLAARDGGAPDRAPESCGWRRDNSGNLTSYGDCIGWVHEDNLYLDPTAAYRVVQVAARDSGETLAVSVHTLKKRLQEKGVLASVDPKRETLTVRRSISGASKAVLHFRRLTLLPEVSDGDEDAL
jgi:hypothetical protein